MKTLTSRIKRRVLLLINNFKSDCAFSILYALLRVMDELCGRVHLNKLSNIAHEKKDKWILNYLERQLSDLIQKYKNIDDIGVFEENAPVWVCWWTGVEMAPDLVKQCIKSIRKQTGSHPVHVIDQNSYSVYIDIPDYMMHKVKNGQMGIAHLSDYIRVSLLEKYGGLWLDSTIFCASSLPKSYFELPFFTCKSNPTSCGYLSQMRWTTFVLGGWRGNVFYRFIKEAFEEYWSQEQAAVDYLFFDYLIEVARCEIPAISMFLKKVPNNNLHRDDLQAAMNQAIGSENFEQVIKSDTVLYKLSWRETYRLRTIDGSESIYQYFLNYHF